MKNTNQTESSPLAVAIHGGAGRFINDFTEKKLSYLKQALDNAWNALCRGAPAIEAVVEALVVLEDSEYFNAGYGGYPNDHGIVLLDVGLMKGSREFVSLINLRRVKYPSRVAFDMLAERPTLMSTWTYELERELDMASDERKKRYGLVKHHQDLIAPYVKKLLEQKEKLEIDNQPLPENHGTVGCVVRDSQGLLAAGTSTGGVSLKSNGRVGDTPVIGSGVFADNEICGLSTTGHGESILRSLLSGFIIGEIRRDLSSDTLIYEREPERLRMLLERELGEMDRKTQGKGAGLVIIPKHGLPQYAFNASSISLALRAGNQNKRLLDRVVISRLNDPDIVAP